MASDFYYFLSSLPMLTLGGAGAPSVEDFLALARQRLSLEECEVLEGLSLVPPEEMTNTAAQVTVLLRWYNWQTAMRNAIAAYRGRGLQRDAASFFREEHDVFPGDARRLAALLEESGAANRQESWEELQWSYLSDLEAGCYFDFSAAVIYGLKLLLVNQRRQRDAAKGTQVFQKVVERHLNAAAKNRRNLE